MVKLRKTHPSDLLNLQNGYYAHFVEDGIAINDVKTYEPRHRVSRINESVNVKSIRLVLNSVFATSVLVGVYLSGFVPLTLLMFVVLYDLRNIKRISLPMNRSNFIPFKNIIEVEMVAGKLGFNYAYIKIKDDNDKVSQKKLPLYDSESTWERAKVLFTHLGILKPLKKKTKDISNLQQIVIGEGITYGIDGDNLLYIENGKHDLEREDPYKYFRFLTTIGLLFTIATIVAKVFKMIVHHNYEVVDFVVLLFFIWVASVPFKLGKRSNANVIEKEDIVEIEDRGKSVLIKTKGWFLYPFVITLNKKYIAENTIEQLNTFYRR